MKNLYLSTAEFYDIDNRHLAYHDVDFYLDYARSVKRGVLEIACGTGRVSIPLARAGHDVVGLDLSAPMLAILQRKLDALEPSIARRIAYRRADMAAFDLGRTFELIVVPFRAFQALTTDERAHDALMCMKRHLTDDGLLILDVFRPQWRLDESWASDEEQVDWVKSDDRTGDTITRTEIRRSIDPARQIICPQITYYVESPGGVIRTLTEELSLRYYYQYQMEVLLVCSGFTIVNCFGYYDRRAADRGSELIFVVRKTTAEAPPWRESRG